MPSIGELYRVYLEGKKKVLLGEHVSHRHERLTNHYFYILNEGMVQPVKDQGGCGYALILSEIFFAFKILNRI
jgi:hypothetical protein